MGVLGGPHARAGGYYLKKTAAPGEPMIKQVFMPGMSPHEEEPMLEEEVCPKGL